MVLIGGMMAMGTFSQAAVIMTEFDLVLDASDKIIIFDVPEREAHIASVYGNKTGTFVLYYPYEDFGQPFITVGTSYATEFGEGVVKSGSSALKLQMGDTVGPEDDYFPQSGNLYSWMPGPDRGYVGLRMNIDGQIHYGWAEISYTEDRFLILHRAAYEDSGAPITVGVIPEPSPAALMVLSVGFTAALGIWRRRSWDQNRVCFLAT